jgi:hypothetical protein
MADETGIVLPWENDAMAGLEMPNGLSYPDQILYLGLRMLYAQYFKKAIDRETATKEKKKLLQVNISVLVMPRLLLLFVMQQPLKEIFT